MKMESMKEFFNNPDMWQNFEYMTAAYNACIFATSIEGFVRKKRVIGRHVKINNEANFYLTYDYKTQKVAEGEEYYQVEPPYGGNYKDALAVVDTSIEPASYQIKITDVIGKTRGQSVSVGDWVRLVDEEPVYDEDGNLIPVDEPSLGTLELDEEHEWIKWVDLMTGNEMHLLVDSVELLVLKPEKGNNRYPGLGLTH